MLHKILPVLCDGYGGFQVGTIEYVMNLYGVPFSQRPIVHDRMLIVIGVIEEIRKQEKK